MHPTRHPGPTRPRPSTMLLAWLALAPLVGCPGTAKEPAPPAANPDPPSLPDAVPAGPRTITVDRKCMGTLCEIKAFHTDEAFVQRVVALGLAEMDRIEALTTSWT